MDKFQVRREASDIHWKHTTPDQRAAAERATGLLKSFAAQPAGRRKPDREPSGHKKRRSWYLPWVDGVRANPVVLLDGGRGSGKTSLLLTLVHAWSARRRHELLCDARKDPSPCHGSTDPRDANDPKRLADPLRGNGVGEEWPGNPKLPEGPKLLEGTEDFVPLDVIDLQHIPESTSLLLRVAGGFLRVVEHLEGGARGREFGDGPLPCRDSWRAFLNVVASGWEGNLSGRKASLDPESYAVELGMTEERGRDLQAGFRAFVDALIKDFDGGCGDGSKTLFIVPIDDGDMNVRRSVELITLLRTLWHPRVAFLLTGHSTMFLASLRAHFLGEARRPLQHVKLAQSELEALSEAQKPIQYARELYDRVIPPSHRCALHPLDVSVRMTHGVTCDGQTIAGVLARFPVGLPGYTLASYFERHAALQRALPDRLRALTDLHQRLKECADEKKGGPEAARRILKAALGQLRLLPHEEDAVHRVVALKATAAPGGEPTLLVHAGELEVDWDYQVIDRRSDDVPGVTLELRLPLDLPRVRLRGRTEPLPKEVAAALLLILDLVADGVGSLIGPSPMTRNPPALVVAELDPFSIASLPPQVWPLPEWESPLDWCVLAQRWEAAWTGVATGDPRSHTILNAYLGAVLDVAESRGQAPSGATGISKRIVDLAGTKAGSRRDRVQRRWAREGVGALRYPELGLGSAARERVDTLLGGKDGTYKDDEGEPHRLHDVALFDAKRIDRRRREIAAQQPAATLVERDVRARQLNALIDGLEGGGSFERRFRDLHVVQPVGSFLGSTAADKVAKYVDPRGELVPRIQIEDQRIFEEILGPYADKIGETDVALVTLWDELLGSGKIPHGDRMLDIDREGLKVKPDLFRERANVVASAQTKGGDLRLLLRTLRLDVVGAGGGRLPPSLELVYRVAADVAKDENDLGDEVPDETQRAWRGLEVRLPRYSATAAWPAVEWDAPLDRELLFQAWNHLTAGKEGAASMLKPEDAGAAPDVSKVLELLALQYVRAVEEIGRSRKKYSMPWQFNVEEKDWLDVVTPYFGKPADGRRWAAFAAFRDRLVFLARPEAGLGPEGAGRVLSALRAMAREFQRELTAEMAVRGGARLDAKAIQAARVALLDVDAGVGRGAAQILQDIDEANPGHPFLDYLSGLSSF